MSADRLTFLLPGDNLSGGVRVTTILGNRLLERGHDVRIAVSTQWRELWENRTLRPLWSEGRHGWLREFRGPVQRYLDVNSLRFARGEVVVGVGTYMIDDLVRLSAPDVAKVRYHHGFPANMTPAQRAAWALPLPTITVSPVHVAPLERLSGKRVSAVVPNGVDARHYFLEPATPRDAIGTVYAVHPNKAPGDIIALMHHVATRWPNVPRIVFGAEPRPLGLPACDYVQAPSVDHARALYNRAQIWLLASHAEGLPGPVLEAMACGAVVISTDNEGSLAVIRDGENGLLVPKGNFAAFLAAIARVRGDAALRARLAGGGFTTAASFSWEAATDRMESFLATLRMPVVVP